MKRGLILLASLIFTLTLIYVICSNDFGRNPPPNFNEADLVGTWRATYGVDRLDTLIIKADGTYKQIYREGDYIYESPWNRWYVEYWAGSKTYLHLEGMRYYVLGRKLRDSSGESGVFYDHDEDRSISVQNKVILAIKGVAADRAPRGIILIQLVSDPDMAGESFILQE